MYKGNDFECPWPRPTDGDTKRGNLEDWCWQPRGNNEATYRATKARPGDDFNIDVTTAKAERLK